MTKQDLQKQLDRAYTSLNNHRDRKAKGETINPRSERVLQSHIRYLKQLIAEAS